VTVIVASHDPNLIQFADTIIELQDGKLVSLERDLDVVEIPSALN
jgi:ABC-type lipoprotein export system ATPase subunit